MNNEEIKSAANELYEAEVAAKQVAATSAKYPDLSMDEAYAIQTELVNRKIAEGRSIVGHKIGLTSKAMQLTMKIDQPDYGVILDDMIFPDGGEFEAAKFTDLRVEAELAFILKDRLEGANATLMDVLSATEYVIPAVELIAARSFRTDPNTGYVRTVRDTISDNASCGGIIMGGRPVKPMDVDLRWVGALLHRNNVIEETGVAAAVMNHPANGVAWLTKTLAAQGRALEPGHIVLAGSFTRPVSARAGDTFHVDYGQLGSLSFSFS